MTNADQCLITGLIHQFEFAGSANGVDYWKCQVCPTWIEEQLDSQP